MEKQERGGDKVAHLLSVPAEPLRHFGSVSEALLFACVCFDLVAAGLSNCGLKRLFGNAAWHHIAPLML